MAGRRKGTPKTGGRKAGTPNKRTVALQNATAAAAERINAGLGREGFLAGKQRVTVLEIARDALHIDVPRLGTADQRRITAALERAGWSRGKRSGHARWWVPADVTHDAP